MRRIKPRPALPVESFPLVQGPLEIADASAMPALRAQGFEVADLVDLPPEPHSCPTQRIRYNHAAGLFIHLVGQYEADNVRAITAPAELTDQFRSSNGPGATAYMVRTPA